MDSQENMPEQTQKSLQDNKKSRKKLIIISILSILVIAVLAFGALWYLKFSQTKSTSENESSKEIKKLTIAILDRPINSFFPESDATYAYYYAISNQLAEGLVAYEGMTKIVPRLATSWKNPDESTWVFDLKKGIKFHTGRTMTADDVVYSINRTKQDDMAQSYSIYSGTISSVKALSKYQVEIKTDEPDAVLLNKLSMLHVIDGSGKYNIATGGTGAYIIKPGTTPTEDKLDLVAFDDYHGGRPMTRQLSYFVADSEQEAFDAVKNGKANIGGELSGEVVSKIDKSSEKVKKISGAFVTYLSINTTRPNTPLQKKEVRQALKLAINLDKVIKDAKIEASPVSQVVTQEIPGYNPDIKVSKQNIEKAKQLLADAGYPNGFTINLTHTKEGNELLAKSIQSQLATIGVKVEDINIESNNFDEYYEKITSGQTDLAILGYSSDTYDAYDVYDGVFRQDGIYKSDQLDEYMSKAETTFDVKKRLKILQDIANYANEDTPVIPLFSRTYYWATDNENYVLPRDISNQALGVYYWKAHLK